MTSSIDSSMPPMMASENLTLPNNNHQLIMDEEPFTPIQKFYDNSNIFITGGTGFLGKSRFKMWCLLAHWLALATHQLFILTKLFILNIYYVDYTNIVIGSFLSFFSTSCQFLCIQLSHSFRLLIFFFLPFLFMSRFTYIFFSFSLYLTVLAHHIVLINKLLTACSSINTIYLLVRNKKGKDVHSRIEDIFDDPVSIKITMNKSSLWREFYAYIEYSTFSHTRTQMYNTMTFSLSISFPLYNYFILFYFNSMATHTVRIGVIIDISFIPTNHCYYYDLFSLASLVCNAQMFSIYFLDFRYNET